MANSVQFEKETCYRCGGSGHYSFNRMHGSTCFRCRGTGWTLTKRGQAAAQLADEVLNVRIEDVPEGAVFKCDDGFGRIYKQCVVAGVSKRGDCEATYSVATVKGTPVCGLGAGCKVRLYPTAEVIERVAAYQESLTKAGKPRKR